MIRNFITISLRTLKRNLSYTLINAVGLSIGLAGSFVIGNWVFQELSFEKGFDDSDKIYRISVSFYSSGAFASSPYILLPTLRESAPEVEIATRIDRGSPVQLKVHNELFEETPFYADSMFFQVFNYPFIEGNPEMALKKPSNIVLSRRMAKKLFGTVDVLGENISLIDNKNGKAGEIIYEVSGIVEKPASPSHLSVDIWIPEHDIEYRENWTGAVTYTYAKIGQRFTADDLEKRLEIFKREYAYPKFNTDIPYNQWKETDVFDFYLRNLEDIHLSPSMRSELSAGGNRANVYVFIAVAFFLLTIAAINFINLSTARAQNRAKEVGIRKTMGTSRKNLIFQFLSESVIMAAISVILGFLVAESFLILFETFTSEQLIEGLFNNWITVALYIIFGLIVGLLAGIYPAFYLSHFKPTDIMKSGFGKENRKVNFRNILVITQFTVSITLIICSLFVYRQLDHLKNTDIGLDRENVLIIENASVLENKKDAFKEQIMEHSEAISASFNKRTPAGKSIWLYTTGKDKESEKGIQTFLGDDQYIPTLGFRLLEGRNFSRNLASDSSGIILTESAVRELMLEEPVIGTELTYGYRVIGVVADFSYKSFYEKPGPAMIMYNPDGYRLAIRLQGNNTAGFISHLENAWSSLNLEEPVNYSFLDETFEQLMEKEKTLGKTVTFFTAIAIFISCLGLFGLAAYISEQRKKEIGIRKVFGATVMSVVLLLNKLFTKQVLLSIIIAAPIAYYLILEWLKNFEFKTEIDVLIFIFPGILALLIAWMAVSFISYRAATINPVETLHEE